MQIATIKKKMKTSTENRLASVEKSIKYNREMIRKGGDKKYYSNQILNLNAIAQDLENKIKEAK